MESTSNKLISVTGCFPAPPLEFYLKSRAADSATRWHQINNCSICYCELYDDIQEDESVKDAKQAHANIMAKLLPA